MFSEQDNQELSVDQIKANYASASQCTLFCKLVKGKKEYTHQGKYHKELIPPNWQLSQQHQSSIQVAHHVIFKEGVEQQLCPCCQQPITKKLINILDDEMALSFLGSGYPLYFNFIKYSLLLMGILYMTSGQFNLITNLLSEDCSSYSIQTQGFNNQLPEQQHHYNKHLSVSGKNELQTITQEQSFLSFQKVVNYCENDFIARSSIANKRFVVIYAQISDWLNLFSIILILIIIFFFRKSQINIDNLCDIKENTPSDYTLIATGFPIMEDAKAKIKDFFEKEIKSQDGTKEQIDVCKINLVYNMDDLDLLLKQDEELLREKKNAIFRCQSGSDHYYRTMWDYDKKIIKQANEIEMKSEEIHHDINKFTGVALVSFKKETQKQFLLKNASSRIKEIVFHFFFGCLIQGGSYLEFEGHRIKILQAPEPTDIIWENIVHTDRRRLNRRISGFILSLFVICSFLCTLLWIAKEQAIAQDQQNTQNGQPSDTQPQAQPSNAHLQAFLCSLFTVFINSFVVDQLSRFLVRFESYETFSQYNVSLAGKLSLTLFFNSALIAYVAHTYFSTNIYGPGGLIYVEFYFFMSNAVLPPMINFVDPNLMQKKLYLWYHKRKGDKCDLTQQEANELQEYPEHEIELKYADIMKTLFITFFYAPLIPFGYIISFVALTLYYWVEKYVILRRQTVKHTPSAQLSILMTEMLEYLPIIYGMANVAFKLQIFGYFSQMAFFGTMIALINALIPMQTIVETFFPADEQDETTDYYEASENFVTDYDRENPITKNLIENIAFESRRNSQFGSNNQKVNFNVFSDADEIDPPENKKGMLNSQVDLNSRLQGVK